MKFKFSLKDKEVSMEADVDKLVEKGMDHKASRPDKRTRYQIKQDEKRKNAELKHKQQLTYFFISMGMFIAIIAFFVIMSLNS
jgi:hypothetical protein